MTKSTSQNKPDNNILLDPNNYKKIINNMGYNNFFYNWGINKLMKDSGFADILNMAQKIKKLPTTKKTINKSQVASKPVAPLVPEVPEVPDKPIITKKAFLLRELTKLAGGPGSNSSKPTKDITKNYRGLALSPVMSLGKRKEFMDGHSPAKVAQLIILDKVKYVSQEKYMPSKLRKFRDNPDLLEKPIDVLFDSDGFYHVMDGHHRFLAAKGMDKKKIKANVYRTTGLKKL